MSELGWVSWSTWALIVIAAAVLRSYAYALYRAVVLGLHTLIFLALAPSDGVVRMVALGLHALVYFDSAALIFPELRSLTYRLLVSWPAQYFAASTLLAFPWAIAAALGLTPHGSWLPYLLGAIGLLQSLTTRAETRSIEVGAVPHLAGIARVPKRTVNETMASGARPLRIVQITDPHLGPFMPVGRLRRICQRAVDQNPDLIVLTGDFLTMESQRDATHLSAALAPLRALSGRTFACFGNHDHEAPHTVCQALHSAGIVLLKDDATSIVTPAGRVQIVGFDFHFRGRAARMGEVSRAHPREPGALRLVLLHDPSAFQHLPPGDADLVLSGHTHGGQVGLVSLGLPWTVAGWLAKIPDHGLWGRGTDRLYVHRGTGHYGFPLRLGVPAEESLLAIYIQG